MRSKKREGPTEYARDYDLTQRMQELGAKDPAGWARSELNEDIPQEARWLLVRAARVAVDVWEPEVVQRSVLAKELIGAGADPSALATFARQVALDTVFEFVYAIDPGIDPAAPADAPGWALVETRDIDGVTWLTGRQVDALHESLGVLSETAEGLEWQ